MDVIITREQSRYSKKHGQAKYALGEIVVFRRQIFRITKVIERDTADGRFICYRAINLWGFDAVFGESDCAPATKDQVTTWRQLSRISNCEHDGAYEMDHMENG